MLPESLLIMTAIATPMAMASPSVFNCHRGRETALELAGVFGFFGLWFLGAIRGECKGSEYGDQSPWHAPVSVKKPLLKLAVSVCDPSARPDTLHPLIELSKLVQCFR